jgi:hypothetical protein
VPEEMLEVGGQEQVGETCSSKGLVKVQNKLKITLDFLLSFLPSAVLDLNESREEQES